MAAYSAILGLNQYDPLRQQVKVAVMIEAQQFIVEPTTTTNHPARLQWALNTLTDLDTVTVQMQGLILAANNTLSVAAIQAATDATVQGQVHTQVLGIVGG